MQKVCGNHNVRISTYPKSSIYCNNSIGFRGWSGKASIYSKSRNLWNFSGIPIFSSILQFLRPSRNPFINVTVSLVFHRSFSWKSEKYQEFSETRKIQHNSHIFAGNCTFHISAYQKSSIYCNNYVGFQRVGRKSQFLPKIP